MADGRPDRWIPISWNKQAELPARTIGPAAALFYNFKLMSSRTWLLIPLLASFCHGSETARLAVRVTWGYTRRASSSYAVKVSADRGMRIGPVAGYAASGCRCRHR